MTVWATGGACIGSHGPYQATTIGVHVSEVAPNFGSDALAILVFQFSWKLK